MIYCAPNMTNVVLLVFYKFLVSKMYEPQVVYNKDKSLHAYYFPTFESFLKQILSTLNHRGP